jgi:hypothetical protein
VNDSAGEQWFGAVLCFGIAGMLLGNVISGGTHAPNFASDIGWLIAWSIGGIGFVISATVTTVRAGRRRRD